VTSLPAAGRSCRQALSALEIAMYRGQRGRTVQCTEVILEVLLAHNVWVSNRIVASRLEALIEKPHLLQTLRAYLTAEMSLQRTAEILMVHPNTVAYRLRQIATLTNRDMRKVTDLSDLIVGLTALDVVEMRRDQSQGGVDLRAKLLG
jgi:sugar diacid utilization regulator